MSSKTEPTNLPLKTESTDVKALTLRLAAPFPPEHVHFRPAVVSGDRAMAIAYVDARAIQDRLDDVLGTENWQDEYEFLDGGSVLCRLRLRIGSEWITKMDVGGPSEQPDEGDRRKAAVSDSLKRAAVKFGIGRYLYRLPTLWVEYDSKRKRFLRPPTLPASALPQQHKAVAKPSPKPKVEATPTPEEKKTPVAAAAVTASQLRPGLPTSGEDLQRRLYAKDQKLAKEGLCDPGELVKHVVEVGSKANLDSDLSTWNQSEAIHLAVEATKAFEAERMGQRSQQPASAKQASNPPRPAPEPPQRQKVA